MTAALTVSSVSKTFPTPEGGQVRALDDVSLDVPDGSFTVLLGPSGCGKTTLLRCIAGLESPDSGEITLHGNRIDDVPVWKRRVNTVFQSYALFPHMTVAQNIAFGLQMDHLPKQEIATKVDQALEMVRLSGLGGRRPNQLSGGQQQRVALARALAKKPEVLLLDEPLSALDLKLRRGMQLELKRLQRETSITFILVTHDQDEAMSMGDQVAVFDSGRIVQVGPPREVYLAPRTRFVADFIGEANILTATRSGTVLTVAGLGNITPESLSGDTNLGDMNSDTASQPLPDEIFLAVRPENVTVSPTPGAAQVADVTFVGGDVHLQLTVGDTTIAVRQSGMAGSNATLSAGDFVTVGFTPGSVRIVEP